MTKRTFHRPNLPATATLTSLALVLTLSQTAVWAQTSETEVAPTTAGTSTPSASAATPATSSSPSSPANAEASTTAVTRIGTVKRVTGEVWAGDAARRRTLVSGDGLDVHDKISSGPKGSASIMLRDGTVLSLGPSSTIDLANFEFDSTTQNGNFLLNLLQGSVRVVTGLIGKANPEKFKVSTPTSVVGVRGTDFIVETEAQ